MEAAKGKFEKILGAAVAITISEDAKMGLTSHSPRPQTRNSKLETRNP